MLTQLIRPQSYVGPKASLIEGQWNKCKTEHRNSCHIQNDPHRTLPATINHPVASDVAVYIPTYEVDAQQLGMTWALQSASMENHEV
jgi:hypothetical protein